MKTLFAMGITHPSKSLGFFAGFGELLTAGIQAATSIYQTRSQEEQAEDLLEFKEKQANAAAAREQEALRIQQEAMKAMQEQAQVKAQATSGTAAGDDLILGMKPVAFYSVAGLAAGALILGTILLTKSK